MLADDAAVAQVYGADGRAPRRGASRLGVLVDLSTVTPEALRAFAPAARAAGVGLLDAPVSGSTALAEAGQLTLMVGGDEADLERARPALEALAKTIFHLGPLGTGAAMKLAVERGDLRPQRGPRRRGSSSRSWPASTARRPTT